MPGQATRNIVLLLLSFTAAGALLAEPIKLSNWKYYKKIQKGKQNFSEKKYASIELDSEVFQKSTLSDLRVVEIQSAKTSPFQKSIPYFVRRYELPPAQKTVKVPEVIYQTTGRKKGRRILYKLPELSESENYTELDFSLPSRYEGGASLLSGPKPDRLSQIGYYTLYSYKGGREKKTHLKVRIPKKHSYLRVEFSSARPAGLLRLYATKKSKELSYRLKPDELEFESSTDNDAHLSRIYLSNPKRRAITQIELTFQQKDFNRPVSVFSYQKKSKQWSSLLYSRLHSRNKASKQVLNLPTPQATPIKIEIQNDFDPPLELLSLSAYAERLELIFDLGRIRSSENEFRLYFGNAYAPAPHYEFASLFLKNEREGSFARFKLGPTKENPDFSYSLLEPPLSIWILRILLVAGSLLVSVLAFRLFQQMGKKAGQPNKSE